MNIYRRAKPKQLRGDHSGRLSCRVDMYTAEKCQTTRTACPSAWFQDHTAWCRSQAPASLKLNRTALLAEARVEAAGSSWLQPFLPRSAFNQAAFNAAVLHLKHHHNGVPNTCLTAPLQTRHLAEGWRQLGKSYQPMSSPAQIWGALGEKEVERGCKKDFLRGLNHSTGTPHSKGQGCCWP